MKVVDKMLGLIGLEMEEADYTEPVDSKDEWANDLKPKKPALVGLPTQKNIKMVIVKPSSYDEVQDIADHLKSRRPIIVNLEDTEKELAQRIVDFISGTTYAIGGSLQKISSGIFVFAPPNVDLQGEFALDKEKTFFNWGK